MKRDCVQKFRSPDFSRYIYFDKINETEINEYLNRTEKHVGSFQKFLRLFLNKLNNEDVYKKESKDVSVIRFFVGHDNDRLYCKEYRFGTNVIITILAVVHEKKRTQKNSGRENKSIQQVDSFDYEIKRDSSGHWI